MKASMKTDRLELACRKRKHGAMPGTFAMGKGPMKRREGRERRRREGERGRAEDEMKSRCGDMKKAAADGKRLKPAIQTLSELGSGGSPGGSQYGHDTSHTENKLHDS